MIKNKISIVTLVFVITANLFAQSGSVYSRYGVGDLQSSFSAKNFSIGGFGFSINDYKYINNSNPATFSSLNTTRFEAGVVSTTSKISDNLSSAFYTQTKFNGFLLGFPVQKDYGIGFVLGLVPYSNVNYDVRKSSESQEFGKFKEDFNGTGELSKLFFGLSYKLPLEFTIGATFEYLIGNNNYSSVLTFDNSDFTNSNFNTNYKYRGLGTTLGLLTPDIAKRLKLEDFSDLRIGVTYNLFGDVNTDTTFSSFTSIGSTDIQKGSFKAKMPIQFGFGLSFKYNSKYRINLDYFYQPWADFSSNYLNNNNLQNLKRYSLGVEYSKALKKFGSFWELVKYRGGLSFEQTQYSINGNGVDQLSFYGGISLPLGIGNSIDIGLMYGIRSNVNDNLTNENIIKAVFSLNLGELWFIRRER